MTRIEKSQLAELVAKTVAAVPVVDIHTHLYPAAFEKLLLWGVDELLTYHYLVAEVLRQDKIAPKKFWSLSKTAQADLIWDALFIRNSPVSESCRGVLTCLREFGIDLKARDLKKIRKYFAAKTAAQHIDTVFKTARIKYVVMTNNPFDPDELPYWPQKQCDPRFKAALRLDDILVGWPAPVKKMNAWGYRVKGKLDAATLGEVRRFLSDWIDKMRALYMAVSLPPDFTFPDKTPRSTLIEKAVLPVAREKGIPLALMIGVRKLVNPDLRLAGDSNGQADPVCLENLCRTFPDNRFLVTFLSRENQHQHCVLARKFANMMPFGCWWFMNNPSIIEEITRERIELLGFSVIPQHSDARVLDQLVYKWNHSKKIVGAVLADKYADLAATGWRPTAAEIARDVEKLFGANFERFLAETPGKK